MNKQDINSLIDSLIIDNERGQITAEVLRNVLKTINEGTADGYVYISAATTNTFPIAIKGDEKVFYIAVKEGVYSNFGIKDIISDLSIIRTYNGEWVVESLGIPLVDLTIELGDSDRKIVTQKKITELYNEGYKYAGVAHTNDRVEPLNGEKKVFMFILQAGIYSNYGISSEITDLSVITSIGKQWFVESLGIPFKLHSKLAEQEQFNDLFSKSLNQIDKAMKDSVLNLQSQIDLLTEGDASAAIESIKEIVAFFAGINDTETLRGILNGLELSLKAEIAKHLPLDGGTMNGDINMNGKRIDNIGIEEVNSLPTTNLYEGRMVRFKNKTYTFYNGLWLALSDDLRGRVNDTHEENFVYQPTASDLSIKDGFAEIKKLKGNTLVWNQLAKIRQSMNYSELSIIKNDGYFLVNGVCTADVTPNLYTVDFILNHKYYVRNTGIVNSTLVSSNSGKIYISSQTGETNILFSFNQGITYENEIIRLEVIDLTKMFGEGNEPATVEEFEAMFPNSYYEYNEGELMSFDGKGLKSVGFNQWDEQWENGTYNTENGKKIENALYIRSANPIPVFPNALYNWRCQLALQDPTNASLRCFVLFYDAEENFISYMPVFVGRFTTPANCRFVRFFMGHSYGTTYNNDICINLVHSGYRNGEYEPYEYYTLSFQDGKTISQLTGKLNGEGDSVVIFPDGLRSAGNVFDEITPDGRAVKRIGSLLLSGLPFRTNADNGFKLGFFAEIPPSYDVNIKSYIGYKENAITSLCPIGTVDRVVNYNDDGFCLYREGNTNYFIFKNSKYNYETDLDSFKQSLAGQILYYELAEPEVYELDFPINTSYEAYDFGTEEVLYNDDKEVNIPMKASVEYGFNAVDMIRNNFKEIEDLKARVTALEQAIQQLQAANTANNEQLEQ